MLRRRVLGSNEEVYHFNADGCFYFFNVYDYSTLTFSGEGLYYSVDGGNNWYKWEPNTPPKPFGYGYYDRLMVIGECIPNGYDGIGHFHCDSAYNIGGNILSLLFLDDFSGKYSLSGYDYAFSRLFKDEPYLTEGGHQELTIPVSILSQCCFYEMFYGCFQISYAPFTDFPDAYGELPDYCYESMFAYCTNLEEIPPINITPRTYSYTNKVIQLGALCFGGMFEGCLKLSNNSIGNFFSNVPYDSFTSIRLADYCFRNMFCACSKLTSLPSQYLRKFKTASKIGYLYPQSCFMDMFSGCDSLTTIPSDLLPTTSEEVDECFHGMFQGCTSLTSIPSGFLSNITMSASCCAYMFAGCTSLVTVPSDLLPFTTLEQGCYRYMFENCISLTTAPDLPAATLTAGCYIDMFRDCTSLNYIKMLATDISASRCLDDWVKNVSSSGTFVKASGASIPTATSSNDYAGIPSGWTVVDE